MKKFILSILAVILFINSGFIVKGANLTSDLNENNPEMYNKIMKQDLFSLMMAYPEYIVNIEQKDNSLYIVLKSGKKILYDDKKQKSPEQKLSNPDLQDMLEQIYPLSPVQSLLDSNFDPGRCRVYELLNQVYGTSKQSIESNLQNVNFHYRSFQFNKNNKAAYSLQNAVNELAELSKNNQNINANVFPCSGTYNYRLISGTNQLSPHSFGIAIDLAVSKKDYWKWSSREDGNKRLSNYPKEIAEVFEKNNFIWGGKWGHFDIMHFEYRPEIIIKSRYFSQNTEENKNWYEGLPLEDISIKNIVDKINDTLK